MTCGSRKAPFPAETHNPVPPATTKVWMRDNALRRVDFPALAALCDVFCPRIFLRQGKPVPSGTISVTTYFHADQQQLDAVGADYVLGTAHANRFSGGYFDQSAQRVDSGWRTAGHLTPDSSTSRLDGILLRTRLAACDIREPSRLRREVSSDSATGRPTAA